MNLWPWSRPEAATPPILQCSFCDKTRLQVEKLIAGPAHHICEACVRTSARMFAEGRKPPAPSTADGLAERLVGRVAGSETAARGLAGLLRLHLSNPVDGPPPALLVGPRGSGKSALLDALASSCGLPAVRFEAGRLTASGYVGDDLENFLGELRQRDLARAERGLLLVDDLQHLAARERPVLTNLDVRGTRAQSHLVRLLERLPAHATIGRRHPSMPHPEFPTRGLMVVLCATLDPLPAGRAAVLDALVDVGIEPALLRRVQVVLPMPTRTADVMLDVVRAVVAELSVEGPVDLDADAMSALARRAAEDPDGAWVVRQQVSAALTRGMARAVGVPQA